MIIQIALGIFLACWIMSDGPEALLSWFIDRWLYFVLFIGFIAYIMN